MEPALARALWHRLETINAVAYFSPECRAAPERLGLRGFWMGYFACRAAPMGPVGAGVVEATFANFHPDRVRRAIPAAWAHADPADVTGARAEAAAAALRRLLGPGDAEHLAGEVVPAAREAIEAADGTGRPLFGANREVAEPPDPVAALWHVATTVREHRGDSHLALLTAAGLDGCESHVLFAACEDAPAELYQQSRGWSPGDWQAAGDRLRARGLLDGSAATDAGRDLRDGIERRTDELAAVPFARVGSTQVERLLAAIGPPAERIAAAGEITFPNPMGLPRPAPGAPEGTDVQGSC